MSAVRDPAPTLTVIGAGKVGQSLARLWSSRRVFTVADLLTRHPGRARAAAAFIGSGRPVASWGDLGPAKVFMLAVPDDAIESAAGELAGSGLIESGGIAFHCSGSKSSAALASLRAAGAAVASLHPVKSFANPGLAVETFPGTHCALEGDERARATLRRSITRCGGRCFDIAAGQKLIYHAATVFASNYLVALSEVALRCFEDAGIARDQALEVALPLLRGTIDNVARLGTIDALTGPIARGDSKLVSAQLEALEERDRRTGTLYALLGRYAVELAAQQAPADAAALEQIADRLRKAAR